ncbi:MAG: alpha/beta hydrolase [Polyangiaceae bacterium]
MTFKTITSADGTRIAFETTGDGAPLVLVGGAFCDRSARASGTPLAALLAHRFTVYSYDRRARGDSGNTLPYAMEREVDDLAALLAHAGGGAHVFGNSSGALLAWDAALRGLPIQKLVMFEPPVIVDRDQAESAEQTAKELDLAVAAERPGDAAELFLTKIVRMPPPVVSRMRGSPMWSGLEKLAHTLSSDVRITARGPARLAEAKTLRTTALFIEGAASPPWMREPLRALTSAMPNASVRTLEGQTHDVDPNVLARAIEAFLN